MHGLHGNTQTDTLDSRELLSLAEELIGANTEEAFGAYFFTSNSPFAELGRQVERSVFLEAFGNTEEQLRYEYGRYEPTSVFFCILDQRRKVPAGMARIILPSAYPGFKSLNDIEPVWDRSVDELIGQSALPLSLARTWDLATLAVDKAYRGAAAVGLTSLGLYQSITRMAQRCGIDWVVAILDLVVYRMSRWKLHTPFRGFNGAPPLPYLGSAASLPAWCRLSEWEERLKESDPVLRDVIFKGSGIEAALRPLDVEAACQEIIAMSEAVSLMSPLALVD